MDLSSIVCGSGVTTGNHYYTDCCGNFIQGTESNLTIILDYTKPSNGVTKLNVPVSTTCPTPTPTPTPTITPSQTVTPTITPSPTKTPTKTPYPSQTPSNSPIYTYKNDCTIFTLFDMGLICVPLAQPSGYNTLDGVLAVKVTGGTSPYSYFWKGGQRTQTLVGMPAGDYEVTVIDYYGDYTASTVCSLVQPTPNPTTTPTTTPTPTVTPSYGKLCIVSTTDGVSSGPYQFTWSGGYINNKPYWTSNSLTMSWISTSNRWEISGWNATAGIPINTNNTTIPTNNWQIAGGPASTITLTDGNCPAYLPLSISTQFTNSSCSDNKNCNGSITITATNGLPVYYVSIDNGNTYHPVTGNIYTFNNLCPNTYTVICKDSDGNTQTKSITISSDSNPIAYTVGVELVKTEGGDGSSGSGTASETATWKLNVTPALPVGTTLSVKLNVNVTQQIQGPFATGGADATGTIINEVKVYKNNIQQSPSSSSGLSSGTLTNRPNCNAQIQTKTSNQIYDLVIGNNDVIQGTAYSNLEFISCVIGGDSCASTLVQDILLSTSSPILNGCTCCSIANNSTPIGVTSHTLNGCPAPSSPIEPIASAYLVYEIIDKESGNYSAVFTLSKVPSNSDPINQITLPFTIPFTYFIRCSGQDVIPYPTGVINIGDSQRTVDYSCGISYGQDLQWASSYPVILTSPFTKLTADPNIFTYTYGGKKYTIYVTGKTSNNYN